MRRAKPQVLVVQLGRLGDTVQTLMALRAAKQLYPDMEITLVVRKRFGAASHRVPWIRQVVELPAGDWINPVRDGRLTQEAILPEVRNWVMGLQKTADGHAWDYLVNWTFSDTSSFLASLIPSHVKLGYVRGSQAGVYCADGWSCFVQGVVQAGVAQNIHLTDVLTTQLLTALQIHLGASTEDTSASVSSKGFFSLHVQDADTPWSWRDTSRTWIAVQLGASHQRTAMAPALAGRLIARLLKEHPEYGVVVLGSAQDREAEEEVLTQLSGLGLDHRRFISLVGKTSFDLWVSVIARCQWLIAGESSAVQIASVVGTRIVSVVTKNSRWIETGPYGNGHYVVECDPSQTCDAEILMAIWEYASQEWSHQRAKSLPAVLAEEGIKASRIQGEVYRSKIRGGAEGGGVYYEALLDPSITFDRWSQDVMGQVARAWYCGWTAPAAQDYARDRIKTELLQSIRALEEPASVLTRVCQKAERIAQRLADRTARLKSDRVMSLRDREEVAELGASLRELDQLIQRLGMLQRPLVAFSHMSKVLMHNLRGDNLHVLGKETANAYRQLQDGAKVVQAWIKATLDLAKPAMVRPDNLVSLDAIRSQAQKEIIP